MQAISRLDRIIPHNPPLRELLAFRKNDPAEPPVIFHINKKNEIETWQPDWNPSELEVERYLMSSTGEDSSILNEEIFKEPLLLLSSQVRTRLKKRARSAGDRPGWKWCSHRTEAPPRLDGRGHTGTPISLRFFQPSWDGVP